MILNKDQVDNAKPAGLVEISVGLVNEHERKTKGVHGIGTIISANLTGLTTGDILYWNGTSWLRINISAMSFASLPTANPGAGLLWNDGNTVKVGT